MASFFRMSDASALTRKFNHKIMENKSCDNKNITIGLFHFHDKVYTL